MHHSCHHTYFVPGIIEQTQNSAKKTKQLQKNGLSFSLIMKKLLEGENRTPSPFSPVNASEYARFLILFDPLGEKLDCSIIVPVRTVVASSFFSMPAYTGKCVSKDSDFIFSSSVAAGILLLPNN